ncbi:hypothetical protein QR680_012858 [Steinernema hermaphroditum]|uniref:SAM-dependent MTase TRM10-type domain-containing protein n=1 Tax=Steinernema hermaphroditum TaxID=289476 RepID=A0AA39M1I0_9BILA|nr:hypothetical protein QR680_012858 [Steinernema hermaphroditum]
MEEDVAFLDSLFEEFSLEKPREVAKAVKSEKRALRYQKVAERRKRRRVEEHQRRRERQKEARGTETEEKPGLEMKRLSVCIDLGFCSAMNSKERGKLIRQLGRVWGLQKRYPGLSTTLVNIDEDFVTDGERIVSGFRSFAWKTTTQRLEDMQSTSAIVYLSPDAEMEPLMFVEDDEMYVIGGLVDESGRGSMSREKAEDLGVKCRRLPIPEYMTKASRGTFNVMLTINQVVEILCRLAVSGNWIDALGPVVPEVGAESSYTHEMRASEDDDFFTAHMVSRRNRLDTHAVEKTELSLERARSSKAELEHVVDIGVTKKRKSGLDAINELIDPVWNFNDDVLLDMMTERVIYEDESVVALDKPYQMAYSGTKPGQAQLDRLLTRLAQRVAPECQKLYVVRTLDKHCTGVVLFAKNLERHAQLREAYEDGRVEQKYHCLVKGVPVEEKATISIPLVKLIKGKDMHLEPVRNPKTALNVYNVITKYEIINSSASNCSLIGATVSKDISHQIRAHLSHGAGCPLIGDNKYNLKNRKLPPKVSPTAMAKLDLAPQQFRRLPMFMHLNQLLIPRGGVNSKYILIRAPVPHAFYYVLKKLSLLKK